MESFNELLKELGTKPKFFSINIIEQTNLSILKKLIQIEKNYNITNNKHTFVSDLVNFGYILEFSISKKNTDILSLQMGNMAGIIKPIINRIKRICLEFNLELVEELKRNIENLIQNDTSLDPTIKKQIKLLNINHYYKNINYHIEKDKVKDKVKAKTNEQENELSFEDFGITIKITNHHYKSIFSNLVERFGIFGPSDIRDKRFDWYWKALSYSETNCIDTIDNYKSVDCKEIMFNFNDLNNANINDELTENNNNDNAKVDEFKIIQKRPEDITRIFENTHSNNKYKIKNQSIDEMSKIISNSLIIEDNSFTIPIDNANNTDYTDYTD